MKSKVNIDFKIVAEAFHEYVLQKARKAGSTVVYMKNGEVVEEDPKNAGRLKKFVLAK